MDLAGHTVGEILSQYGVDYSTVRLIDEPPGRLWGMEISFQQDAQPQRVVVEFEHHSGLFSADRKWPQGMVEKQKVVRVHASPASQF